MSPFEGFKITSIYGNRIHPVSGKWQFHNGIDLVKADKSPVLAFVSGEVIHAKMGVDDSGIPSAMGNVVAVKDEYGVVHLYAHLHSISVKVGDKIVAGKEVGMQGTTGTSTASHLHYEVRSKNTSLYGSGYAIEPTSYLYEYNARKLAKIKDDLIVLCQDEYNRSIPSLPYKRDVMGTKRASEMADVLRLFK